MKQQNRTTEAASEPIKSYNYCSDEAQESLNNILFNWYEEMCPLCTFCYSLD